MAEHILDVGALIIVGRARRERDEARAEIERLRVALAAEGVASYYRGVADAMDVIRAYDFPLTERVDHIADKLAPTQEDHRG